MWEEAISKLFSTDPPKILRTDENDLSWNPQFSSSNDTFNNESLLIIVVGLTEFTKDKDLMVDGDAEMEVAPAKFKDLASTFENIVDLPLPLFK